MQCLTTRGDGLEQLAWQDRTPGPVGPSDVLVDVRAVSLNYRDLLVASGKYGRPTEEPFVAGSDMCGMVRQIGSAVTNLQPGQRVINAPLKNWIDGPLDAIKASSFVGAQGVEGVFAEQVIYPADALVPAPSHLSDTEAATLTVAGLTAWAAIVTFGQVQAGDWVLLLGTGGVSCFAAQFASLKNARVIVASASPDKVARLRESSTIQETVDYRDESWPQQVRKLTGGKGVQLVVDVAGGRTLSAAIAACGYHAKIAAIGVLDGSESTISLFPILSKLISIRGIYMESAAELRKMAATVEEKKVAPIVGQVFPWSELPVAYRELQQHHHVGKLVAQLDER